MNNMQGFYASISSVGQSHSSYLRALVEITKINLKQAMALRSDLGWQEWSTQNQKTATWGG